MKNVTLCLFLICFLSVGETASATPKKVVAGPESTVYGIAYENGIPTRALIAANNLKSPYVLQKGQVLIIPSPNEHVAGQGETLQSIAEEYGVDVDVLAQENNAQAIQKGERLSIPSRDTESLAKALKPPVDNIATSSLAPLPSVKSAPLAGKTRVPASDSRQENALPSELAAEIAREKGTTGGTVVNAKMVAVKEDTSSKAGLMGNLTQRNAGAPTAATTLVREEEEVELPKKQGKTKEKLAEKKKEQPKKETQANVKEKVKDSPSKKEESQADAKFIWPVEGNVISKFSPGKNDGIKIKVPEGTSVKAAAAGDVLYAGNELKGFGNLLLLKHKGGWVTAYAYNSSLLVKKGDSVKQGQVIAKSGKTGGVNEAQLHFEVRKGKQPVDPLTKLES